MNNELRKLSIIVFSRERQQLLQQLYGFWEKHPVQLIILDQSSVRSSFFDLNFGSIAEVNYHWGGTLPERALLATQLINREFTIILSDDDFVSPHSANRAINNLMNCEDVIGAYNYRNFSRESLSLTDPTLDYGFLSKPFQQRMNEITKKLSDAPWLAIIKTQIVKFALTVAASNIKDTWKDDRLAADLFGIGYILAVTMRGKLIRLDYILYFKRSFDYPTHISFQRVLEYDSKKTRFRIALNKRLDLAKRTFVAPYSGDIVVAMQECGYRSISDLILIVQSIDECFNNYIFERKLIRIPDKRFSFKRLSRYIEKKRQEFFGLIFPNEETPQMSRNSEYISLAEMKNEQNCQAVDELIEYLTDHESNNNGN